MQKEINNIIKEIKKGQDEKEEQFKTILDKPVFGKKVVERRLTLDFAEIVDVNENDLIGLDIGSKKYRKVCESNVSNEISVKFLKFGKDIQNTENCTITKFEEATRLLEECPQDSEELEHPQIKVVECKVPKQVGDAISKLLKSITEE